MMGLNHVLSFARLLEKAEDFPIKRVSANMLSVGVRPHPQSPHRPEQFSWSTEPFGDHARRLVEAGR